MPVDVHEACGCTGDVGQCVTVGLRGTRARTNRDEVNQAREGYGPTVHGINETAAMHLEEWPI